MPGADESIRILLGPPAKTEFRVESPDGAPVAGAVERPTNHAGLVKRPRPGG